MSVPTVKKLNDLVSDDIYPGQVLKVLIPNEESLQQILSVKPELMGMIGNSESEVKQLMQSTKNTSMRTTPSF